MEARGPITEHEGTAVPTYGISTYNYAPQDMLNLAVHAERLGFEGLWFGDHAR